MTHRTSFVVQGSFVCLVLSACTGLTLEVPEQPMIVGGYQKVPVNIPSHLGLEMEDIRFVVPAGPAAGEVSLSSDRGTPPGEMDIMLLAGHKPGVHELQAIEIATGDVLATEEFEVRSTWDQEQEGPPLWFAGQLDQAAGVPGAAWGGGAEDAPQNVEVHAAPESWHINIILFDTDGARYPSDAAAQAALVQEWQDEAQDGTPSASKFYDEVSFGEFTVTATTHGPIQMTGEFEDYFDAVTHPQGSTVWAPGSNLYQDVATAADDLIDFGSNQSFVCVSKSVDGSQFAWPYAGPRSIVTAEGTFNLGCISMPVDWETVDGRDIHVTLSHELGHSLGLSDQYHPEVMMFNPPTQSRNIGTWDLMDSESGLPHFSLFHRLQLGWVDPDWLELFNFEVKEAPVSESVQLHPVEKGQPPAGSKSGIEVRVANGWNYYFEYRKSQTGDVGDQKLDADNIVLGTDTVSAPHSPASDRPDLLHLDNDPDLDGTLLVNGKNYREVDVSDPMFPTDFQVDVSGIDGTEATLTVNYGVSSKPDPYIRPWPASEDRRWQSPDIEVVNARSQADSQWKNSPWAENDNTIIATVYNGGALQANDVEVQFKIKDFNVGDFTVIEDLGSVTHDIAPKGQATFEMEWVPPAIGHYCVVAEILDYQTSTGVAEITSQNNWAQSNYSRFVSDTESPPSRESTYVSVSNPYDLPTRVHFLPGQSNPFYRTYLQHRWLWLEAGERTRVQVMFEYAPGAHQYAPLEDDKQRPRGEPNDVSVVAFVEDPRSRRVDAPRLYGGVDVQVATGRAVRVVEFDVDRKERAARGMVITKDNGQRISDGVVLLKVTDDKDQVTYLESSLAVGEFETSLPGNWETVQAFFVPSGPFGEAQSEIIER